MEHFSTYAAALQKQVGRVAGVQVTYSTSAGNCVLCANRGRSTMITDDGAGGRIEALSDDWIVPSASLLIGGVPWTPLEGDTITYSPPGAGSPQIYQLMTPPYRKADAWGRNLRIHTKMVTAN